jgi:hypothetical protein
MYLILVKHFFITAVCIKFFNIFKLAWRFEYYSIWYLNWRCSGYNIILGVKPVVLSKYQAMFKVLQWNARLWKISTLKIALSSPRNSLFISHASNPPYPYRFEYYSIWYLNWRCSGYNIILGVKPVIQPIRANTKVIPFKEKSSFKISGHI